MRTSVEKLTEELLALPADARALIADCLAESLDPLLEEDLRALWATEGLQRRDELRAGKVKAIPAEAVFALVRKGIDG